MDKWPLNPSALPWVPAFAPRTASAVKLRLMPPPSGFEPACVHTNAASIHAEGPLQASSLAGNLLDPNGLPANQAV